MKRGRRGTAVSEASSNDGRRDVRRTAMAAGDGRAMAGHGAVVATVAAATEIVSVRATVEGGMAAEVCDGRRCAGRGGGYQSRR